jgi:hypothetical protein
LFVLCFYTSKQQPSSKSGKKWVFGYSNFIKVRKEMPENGIAGGIKKCSDLFY